MDDPSGSIFIDVTVSGASIVTLPKGTFRQQKMQNCQSQGWSKFMFRNLVVYIIMFGNHGVEREYIRIFIYYQANLVRWHHFQAFYSSYQTAEWPVCTEMDLKGKLGAITLLNCKKKKVGILVESVFAYLALPLTKVGWSLSLNLWRENELHDWSAYWDVSSC